MELDKGVVAVFEIFCEFGDAELNRGRFVIGVERQEMITFLDEGFVERICVVCITVY